MRIRGYRTEDEVAVIRLWDACDLTRPWNDPRRDIARKLAEQPDLFLVGECGGGVMASVMAGYDGHRGWVYYLAVAPEHRGAGLGRRLMAEVEARLRVRGCAKLNLQVRADNAEVLAVYRALGYVQDDVVSLGRRLIPDRE